VVVGVKIGTLSTIVWPGRGKSIRHLGSLAETHLDYICRRWGLGIIYEDSMKINDAACFPSCASTYKNGLPELHVRIYV